MTEAELEMLNQLKNVSGIFEVYHRTTFKCYRNAKSGGVQEVLVEILDSGPEDNPRYSVIATTADGKSASGNSDSSIDAAIAMVHWWDLDG